MKKIRTGADYMNMKPSEMKRLIGEVMKGVEKDQQATLDRYEQAVADGKNN